MPAEKIAALAHRSNHVEWNAFDGRHGIDRVNVMIGLVESRTNALGHRRVDDELPYGTRLLLAKNASDHDAGVGDETPAWLDDQLDVRRQAFQRLDNGSNVLVDRRDSRVLVPGTRSMGVPFVVDVQSAADVEKTQVRKAFLVEERDHRLHAIDDHLGVRNRRAEMAVKAVQTNPFVLIGLDELVHGLEIVGARAEFARLRRRRVVRVHVRIAQDRIDADENVGDLLRLPSVRENLVQIEQTVDVENHAGVDRHADAFIELAVAVVDDR